MKYKVRVEIGKIQIMLNKSEMMFTMSNNAEMLQKQLWAYSPTDYAKLVSYKEPAFLLFGY
ncbi:hypothetical protein GCM10028827_11540 [Mucilaginibacter myungsuensis]